jgi:hypothetical protein
MPDWKNKEDYAYTSSLKPEGWAFEFLRRNKEYQTDYKRLEKAHQTLTKKYGPQSKETKSKWYADPLFWHYEPDLFPGEKYNEWVDRAVHQGVEPQRTKLHEHVSNKWGLRSFPPNPSHPAYSPPQFSETGAFPLFPDYHRVGEFFEGDYPKTGPNGEPHWITGAGPYRQKHGYAIVVFQLDLRLDPQLDILKKKLRETQQQQEKAGHIKPLKKYTPVKVIDVFVRYLRVLDGDAAGATRADMGKIIFGWKGETGGFGDSATKSTWDSLKAAREYVDRKYIVIPQLKLASDQKTP